ncbi:helix-turn-helix domain-containing protein [Nocardiopsis flavescens]|uniref:helix-turn-helix domain-containing protein n=1 Tax=Nocardiopsis flavescens TaxID=758803 RepID=UPI0036465F5C
MHTPEPPPSAPLSTNPPPPRLAPLPPHTDPPLPELVTPGEVAALFGVDAKTVTRWVLRGKLPGVRTPSGHHRFLRTDVDRLLRQAGATP